MNMEDDPILSDGPLLYWKHDETSGTTAIDSSGNGYHGTYGGDYTLHGDGGIEWRLLNGWCLGPSDAALDVGSDGIYTTRDCHHALGVRESPANSLLGRETASPETRITACGCATTPAPASRSWRVANYVFSLGVKVHVMIVSDGVNCIHYINGVQDAIGAAGLSAFTTHPIRIGNNVYPGYGHNGRQSHTAIYDYALSPARALAHAQFHGVA